MSSKASNINEYQNMILSSFPRIYLIPTLIQIIVNIEQGNTCIELSSRALIEKNIIRYKENVR